ADFESGLWRIMIDYKHGVWGMGVLLKRRGSVIPKALVWSLPCAIITVLLHQSVESEKGNDSLEMEGIMTIWSSFTFVLGFLIVFRSNQAYSRFWESVTLFQQTSGEWTSALSNLLSFCRLDEEVNFEVLKFQQYLIKLLSLLHCSALQTMCELDDDSLEILSLTGIEEKSLRHLKNSPDRAETVLLWIEKLIIDANNRNLFEVPAPILSRAFQELSQGMVGVNDVRKIRMVPFPFPYSQYLSLMLVCHWMLTPVMASQLVVKPYWAGVIVFVVSTSFWTLFYIAQEIDQPFGEDANDLPVREMQKDFNEKLEYFTDPLSYTLPAFNPRNMDQKKTQVMDSSFTFNRDSIGSRTHSDLGRLEEGKVTSSCESSDPSDSAVLTAGGFTCGVKAHEPLNLEELRHLIEGLQAPSEVSLLWRELEDHQILPPSTATDAASGSGSTLMSLQQLTAALEDFLARHTAEDPSYSRLERLKAKLSELQGLETVAQILSVADTGQDLDITGIESQLDQTLLGSQRGHIVTANVRQVPYPAKVALFG
ncbi:unnamed protein product, partial [Cladocopium goreaui]